MVRAQSMLHHQNITTQAVQEERMAVKAYALASRNEELEACQKARSNTLLLSDQNTEYFHSMVKERRTVNRIACIYNAQGDKLERSEDIEAECVLHYQGVFAGGHDNEYDASIINNLEFNTVLTEDMAADLAKDVQRNEITEALSSIDSSKAPGPDGFTSFFFKVAWRIVGNCFIKAIDNIFRNSKLLGQVNTTLVALVPKVTNASYFSDYRPIACCNVLYKCIAKVLTNRMKSAVQLLVSPNQSAFIQGRYIQDNLMLAHELVRNYHRNKGTQRCAAKIDLKKAYDMVRWESILHVLEKMNFPSQFIKWISECITTPKFFINLNGTPKGYITATRGIRQGCPMSPYLFVIVMKVLNILLMNKVNQGDYKLHYKCSDPAITHLSFADDLVAFFHGDIGSAKSLYDTLHEFRLCSGLEVNFSKNTLFAAGIPQHELGLIASQLQFPVGQLPIRYLGLPLISTRLSHQQCSPIIEKIRKRINSWKNKFLTYAGRVILIKSVLCSMQVYWTACFILPKRTMKTINCIFRSFLWSGDDTPTKKAMINWKSVCKPFKEGGLGIRNIEVSNVSACLKQIWHLVSNKDSIWVSWVHRNLIKQRDFWIMKAPTDASWCWKHILECRVQAAGLIHFSIGDGQNIKFWKDPWHPMGILIDKFPQELLYDSLLHKEARASALIRNGRWCVPPHIEPSIVDITSQLDVVEVDCESLDEVVWRAGPNGTYSIHMKL